MKFFNHLDEPTPFEGYYNQVRKLEGRLLSLEQIKRLPQTDKDYQYHEEWNLRISSTERILTYLAQKKTSACSILAVVMAGFFTNSKT